jgi:hypothetical protein
MSESVIVAVITATGTIIAAIIATWGSTVKKWPLATKGTLVVVGLIIGFGVGMLVTCNRDPCLSAKITSPQGAPPDRRNDAAFFPTSSPVEVSWDRTDCVMAIEYFQNNKQGAKYKNVTSGQMINVGAPGSGETEIKLWREGATEPSHSVWVWVK